MSPRDSWLPSRFSNIYTHAYVIYTRCSVRRGNITLKLVGSLIPNDSPSYRLYGSKFHLSPLSFPPRSSRSVAGLVLPGDIIKFPGRIEAKENSFLSLGVIKKEPPRDGSRSTAGRSGWRAENLPSASEKFRSIRFSLSKFSRAGRRGGGWKALGDISARWNEFNSTDGRREISEHRQLTCSRYFSRLPPMKYHSLSRFHSFRDRADKRNNPVFPMVCDEKMSDCDHRTSPPSLSLSLCIFTRLHDRQSVQAQLWTSIGLTTARHFAGSGTGGEGSIC